MKKLSLFILIIATVFASCGSDDDATQPETGEVNDETLIVGKWEVTSIVIDGEALEADDCELNSTLEIKADKTYEEQTYGGFSGGPCSPDPLISGTWELSGKTFTQKGDTSFSSTILELSATTLKYEFEDEDTLSDGTVVTFKEEWTFTK